MSTVSGTGVGGNDTCEASDHILYYDAVDGRHGTINIIRQWLAAANARSSSANAVMDSAIEMKESSR